MRLLFRLLIKKVALFHRKKLLLAFPEKYSILDTGAHAAAMARKKPKPFSVTKAVKANARAQVGPPRPGKVILSEPRESRRARKHKPSLADVLTETD